MPEWIGDWTAETAVPYLQTKTAPLRLACHTPSGHPWILSLWYLYRDGTFHCATGANATVVDYLEADDRVAVEVSDDEPPYRGVRGAGHATLSIDEEKQVLGSLLERYLGSTDTELGKRLLDPDRTEIHVRIDVETLHTWDFTDRMSDVSGSHTV